jgi:ATP-binding cassette subfamily F protein 3
MNLLQVKNATKQYGSKILFDGAGFSVNENEHIGVIGPNGAGKTTLFKVLTGQIDFDAGEIVKSNQLRMGYLEQESDWALDVSANEFLESNCLTPLWKLKKLGLELGLSESHFADAMRLLSGGYRMRMKLLYLIGQEPNLMLLDEPTNFLDLESVIVLENFLQEFNGSFLLISHDREFLKRTTEATLEIEAGDIVKFPGHIEDYFEQKEIQRQMKLAEAANVEAKRKHMQDFVDRFKAKATKARQAQSRMKQLEKLERVEIKQLPTKARIKIPDPVHTGKESLFLENADIGYFNKKILSQVTLRLERGVHLGIVGVNGAGKSTLLKTLAGLIPTLKGELKLGYQVQVSYFSQHSSDQLNLEDTVLQALQSAAHSDVLKQDILNVAGSLLFSGEAIEKKIKVLSGGEKSRVALGQILLKKSPVLLLDEPTNHLDFDTVETLTDALKKYPGTVAVVSHDRSFIGRISTKILNIESGKASVYPGSYEEYVWSVQQRLLSLTDDRKVEVEKITVTTKEKIETAHDPFKGKSSLKKLQFEIKELEKQIKKDEAKLEQAIQKKASIEAQLTQALGPVELKSLTTELSYLVVQIENLESELLLSMEQLQNKKPGVT